MIITQLPEFYLRGSLANETMANLTEVEKEKATFITDFVANHEVLQKHKRKFMRELSTTIGGDYRDPDSAEQDYYVTIWRGVVILYFHRKYVFECTKCGARTYRNKSGTISEIRTREEVCPHCGCEGENGESPIKAIVVDTHHDDPDSVINDETQLSRYFSAQLTNAVRQQLRENPIITTTRTNLVTDFADNQIIRSVQSILDGAKISSQMVSTDHGTNSENCIYFDTLGVPSKIIGQLSVIRREAQENGVIVDIDNTGIRIKRGIDCKSTTQSVTEKVHVKMMTPSQGNPDAPNPIEVPPENEMDHVAAIASNDFVSTVFARVPNDHCRVVLEIGQQKGEWFDRYVEKFGTHRFYWKNIESLLGLSKKEGSTVRKQCEATWMSLKAEA